MTLLPHLSFLTKAPGGGTTSGITGPPVSGVTPMPPRHPGPSFDGSVGGSMDTWTPPRNPLPVLGGGFHPGPSTEGSVGTPMDTWSPPRTEGFPGYPGLFAPRLRRPSSFSDPRVLAILRGLGIPY